MPTITKIRVDIPIEDSVLQIYEKAAAERGIGLEALIGSHLLRTKAAAGDDNPFYLAPAEVSDIRKSLGAKVSTPAKLVEMIRRITGWKIGGVSIKLTPNQQEQIHWYAKSAGKPVAEIAQMVIERAITRELKTR